MTRLRAAWILPIAQPPIAGGVVAIDGGRVQAVGPYDGGPVEELGAVAVLPGLVNAHTHLELSWMRGQVPPGGSMPAWASRLMALRRSVSHEPPEPIVRAIAEARRTGTCLLGDVTNTLATFAPLLETDLSAVLFRELLGFSVVDPDALVAQVSAQIASLTPVEWRSGGPRARGRSAFTSPNPRRRSSSCARARESGGRCWNRSASGIRRGRRRRADPSSTSIGSAWWAVISSPSTACS
jgi:hypothetical protein